MKGFWGFTKRNLMIFFKDRQSVIFSMLTSIIVLSLYLLFLKGTFVDAIQSSIDMYPGLSQLVDGEQVDMLANLILLTGVAGSAMITVPYNSLMTVVRDRESKIDFDILATPLKRGYIVLSYFVSAALSSIILTCIILTAGLLMVGLQGETFLTASNILSAFGIVAFGSVSATAFFMLVMLCFKTSSSCAAFFGMLSAAAGFVIGAYIPISQFSDSVQTVCNIFPASHVTIMLRNELMNGILDSIDSSLNGIDGGAFVTAIKELFSFKARLFGNDLEMTQMSIYVAVCFAVCLILQTVLYTKNYRKK